MNSVEPGGHLVERRQAEAVEVDRDQSIFVRGTVLLEAPVTATRLISSIIAMLFDIKPVLRSLGDHLPALAQAIPGWDHATETIGAAPEAQAPSSAG